MNYGSQNCPECGYELHVEQGFTELAMDALDKSENLLMVNDFEEKNMAVSAKTCPECGFELFDISEKCSECGYEFLESADMSGIHQNVETVVVFEIVCPECGYGTDQKSETCPECGFNLKFQTLNDNLPANESNNKVQAPIIVCPECGFEINYLSGSCPECGYEF